MKQWFNFYLNVNEKMHGKINEWLFGIIIPVIIAFVLKSYGIFLLDCVVTTGVDITTTGIGGTAIVIVLNVFGLYMVGFVSLIVVGLFVLTVSKIWEWLVARFKGIQNFFNILKTAKEEEFDSTNVEMTPKKQAMNIKE